MSKILIEGNKVIIEGHANDLETCNTLTNLCDELSTSEKFRTVKYESGYGEFESVSENDEKKFAVVEPVARKVNIKSNDGTVTLLQDSHIDSVKVTSTDVYLKAGGMVSTSYTYSGSKLFAGLATSANATAPKYKPGDTIEITAETTLYIVENIIIPEHHSSLNELFTNIATVIREKTGDATSIVADDFPNVIRERLEVIPPIPYLTFSSPSSFTLALNNATKHWDGTLEYSTNASTWSTWDGTTTLSSATSGSDNVLYLRGTGNTVITGGDRHNYKWILTGSDISCIGNIENLIDYATVEAGAHPTMAPYCYSYMFYGCTALTQAPALPATTLADGCYYYMFKGCTALTQAPALPATTLTDHCYYYMFNGCKSLTQAPALPATTLAVDCYSYMFYGCTALTQAPALPATTLANSCYYYMFYGCKSLTQAPALPATTLANYCYSYMFNGCTALTQAPALSATTLADHCYHYMFNGCTSLTQAPYLPATTLANSCYYSMFNGCTSLTQAPALPATILTPYCYYYMFKDCKSLTQAPALPATALTDHCYYSMFRDCTRLTKAPALSATTLADSCYSYMFWGCTSLTQAPALPATTLADSCYSYMFNGCTALTKAPALPATTLANNCYSYMFYGCTALTQAPALPATTLANSCYRSMLNRCTNLTQAPSLPATMLVDNCYRFMFEFTAITAIPRIRATTYATDSCKGMFDDIKTLNVYSRSGPGHEYGWTAPASTYCSGMFGSDDGESEWAKLDGSNFPNGGTPKEGVTYYFATVD